MNAWLLAVAIARAQSPEAPVANEPGADAAEPAAEEEIVVYGELRVQEAWDHVVSDFEHLGYRKIVDKGDRLVLKHETSWKGKVVLHDAGFVEFKRQGVKGTMPDTFFKDASPLVGWVPCLVVPTACVKVGGVVVGKRKLSAVEDRTTRFVARDLETLNARMSDLAVDHKLDELPTALEQCWHDGVPLDGEGTLPDPASRRQHLMAYWASRTDTVWGERVRAMVEGFLRGVVQTSEHPVEDDELSSFNASSGASRPLRLLR